MKLLGKLDEISELLTLLVELSVPPLNIKGLRLGRTEKDVLALCDLKHAEQDMASKLGKKSSHIRKTLAGLRKKGLIRSVKVRKRTYYLRVMR